MTETRQLELLAPARDLTIGCQAVIHGADAVYIGAEAFGARAAAGNSVDDIASLVDFAHNYDARVYVTLNTLIYDHELREAENLIKRLYRVGVDALIVQDLSVLRMDIPPIALHASTQCDTRTPEKARFLQDCGFSQIVLARELSLEQIRAVADAVTVPLEAFVHGSICVSYNGDCQASLLATGRSANRGECAQMCRLPYTLVDREGRTVAPEAHYLSLRDMNRVDRLADLVAAGVSSFKIEGRLKESDYVRTTVGAYHKALDQIVSQSDGRYSRSSIGEVRLNFEPDLSRVFNRKFTSYFLDGRPANTLRMASLDTPKWIGRPVGKVISAKGRRVRLMADEPLHNGDGVGYFAADGRYVGFRVNRVEGDTVFTASDVDIPAGTRLFRNRDKQRDDSMAGVTAVRRIPVTAVLRLVGEDRIALSLSISTGASAEVIVDCPAQPARTPQADSRRRVIDRLGDTVYLLQNLEDNIPEDIFIQASVLTDLRRKTVVALDSVRKARYIYDYRRPEKQDIKPFKSAPLDRHDNVSNNLAGRFYADHGIAVAEPATEVRIPDNNCDQRVMTTRYCLRRELGACLKSPGASSLPSPLFLQAAGIRYRLDFDCDNCSMKVIAPAR